MYIPDLSSYVNSKGEEEPDTYSVGWLDDKHDFPQGEVSVSILQRILALCFNPVNATRGFHRSPFLKTLQIGYPVKYKGMKMLLGSAEIRVKAKNGKIYAAPNLIYHYIKDCNYSPPKEFLEAIQNISESEIRGTDNRE